MLDLYGMSSPNVLKIILFLEEVGAEYRFHIVNLLAGEQFDEGFKTLNPMQKVPVVVDRDGPGGDRMTIFESAAILCYLARKHKQFLPAEQREESEVLQWLMVEAASAGPLLGQYNHFLRFAPENTYSLNRYRTLAGRAYDMFDNRLRDREFLAACDYSIADMTLFPWVESFYEFHRMRWDEHPNLARWHRSVRARPGTVRALARYQEIKAQDPTFSQPPSPETLDMVLGRGKFTRS
jgi:GSH-dependent disulfide-bond oxidoreductase